MSSLFTPIFFPPPSKSTSNVRARSSSSPPSSSSLPPDPIVAHTTFLSSVHLALSRLEPVLCPPSPPGSPKPESLERISRIREQVIDAVDAADGERSCGKWGQVARRLKLSCTRGRWGYQEVVAGARTKRSSQDMKVDNGLKQWVLANTEDEWFEWERKRDEDRRRDEMDADMGLDGRAEELMVIDKDEGSLGVKERVKIWQQNVPIGVEPAPPSSIPMNTQGESWAVSGAASIARKNSRQSDLTAGAKPISSPPLAPLVHNAQRQQRASAKMAVVKNKAKASVRDQKEPLLGFPVIKRSSATSVPGKKPNNDPTPVQSLQPKDTRDGKSPLSPVRVANPDVEMASSNPLGDMPPPPNVVAKIGDVPEMSFLPPSFPSEMETSTPNRKEDIIREKPPPITSSSLPFPSSPGPAPPSTNFHSPNKPDAANISSSLPPLSSHHQQPAKRPREITPPLQTSSDALPTSFPPPKKARTMPGGVSDNFAIPVTPSTPPPGVKSVIGSKGLGNAKGLPVPSTPERHLPTLTELLASSRRSKPRPRPASRTVKAGDLPYTKEMNMKDRTPDPSPAKSMFSSPASGSTMSPASMIIPLRSPATPTFTQHPSAFAPDFMSSQVPLGTGSAFGQGSSGFLGTGYDSQFDVEGQVDRVSELLERDVDFDGWLRDIPAMEGESSQLA